MTFFTFSRVTFGLAVAPRSIAFAVEYRVFRGSSRSLEKVRSRRQIVADFRRYFQSFVHLLPLELPPALPLDRNARLRRVFAQTSDGATTSAVHRCSHH